MAALAVFARFFLTRLGFFLAGFAVALALGAIVEAWDLVLPAHSRSVARLWHVYEGSHGELVIVPSSDLTIKVSRDKASGDMDTLRVMKKDFGDVFKYQAKGEVGTPEAQYCAGGLNDWTTWIDLNFDGVFDEKMDLARETACINVDGRWVQATIKGGTAEAEEGKYTFDVHSGNWVGEKR